MNAFETVKEKSDAHIMPTYARYDVAFVSGKGATLKGTDGKDYIDFGSGIGVNALGHADTGWVKAVTDQAAKTAHLSNLYYNPLQAELSALLCGVTGFGKVFFCNSGAEANEGAIKLARKYSFDKYGGGRSTIVALRNSFHGRTITTLSATGQDVFHNYFFPFTEGFRFVGAGDTDALEREIASGDVCAVMLEAVQGEGGVYPMPADFVAKAAALARANDVLLIFDEVQCGVGRTGKFFGFEHYGVHPDVVTCAKALAGGLPMGAVLCGASLGNVLGPGSHGSTFGGNPMACAGAIEVVGRVSKPEFLCEVAHKGDYIRQKVSAMPGVGEVRGFGLMLGFEAEGVDSAEAAALAVKNGLLILTAKKALRMLPPLVITREETDAGLAILAYVLEKLRRG